MTFEAVARDWFSKKRTAWTESHQKKILSRLENQLFPHIGNKQISALEARGRTRYFQGKENRGMQEARRFPCVPCFIFLKVSWNVSNRSFPALTVFPVWIDRRVVNGIKH